MISDLKTLSSALRQISINNRDLGFDEDKYLHINELHKILIEDEPIVFLSVFSSDIPVKNKKGILSHIIDNEHFPEHILEVLRRFWLQNIFCTFILKLNEDILEINETLESFLKPLKEYLSLFLSSFRNQITDENVISCFYHKEQKSAYQEIKKIKEHLNFKINLLAQKEQSLFKLLIAIYKYRRLETNLTEIFCVTGSFSSNKGNVYLVSFEKIKSGINKIDLFILDQNIILQEKDFLIKKLSDFIRNYDTSSHYIITFRSMFPTKNNVKIMGSSFNLSLHVLSLYLLEYNKIISLEHGISASGDVGQHDKLIEIGYLNSKIETIKEYNKIYSLNKIKVLCLPEANKNDIGSLKNKELNIFSFNNLNFDPFSSYVNAKKTFFTEILNDKEKIIYFYNEYISVKGAKFFSENIEEILFNSDKTIIIPCMPESKTPKEISLFICSFLAYTRDKEKFTSFPVPVVIDISKLNNKYSFEKNIKQNLINEFIDKGITETYIELSLRNKESFIFIIYINSYPKNNEIIDKAEENYLKYITSNFHSLIITKSIEQANYLSNFYDKDKTEIRIYNKNDNWKYSFFGTDPNTLFNYSELGLDTSYKIYKEKQKDENNHTFYNFLDKFYSKDQKSTNIQNLPYFLPIKLTSYIFEDKVDHIIKADTSKGLLEIVSEEIYTADKNLVILLGNAGSGKTTLMLGIVYAINNLQSSLSDYMPMYINIPSIITDKLGKINNILEVFVASTNSALFSNIQDINSLKTLLNYSPPLIFFIDTTALMHKGNKKIANKASINGLIDFLENITDIFYGTKHKIIVCHRGTIVNFKYGSDELYEKIKNLGLTLEINKLERKQAENYIKYVGGDKAEKILSRIPTEAQNIIENPLLADFIILMSLNYLESNTEITSMAHLFLLFTRNRLSYEYKRFFEQNIISESWAILSGTDQNKNNLFSKWNYLIGSDLDAHPVELLLQLFSKETDIKDIIEFIKYIVQTDNLEKIFLNNDIKSIYNLEHSWLKSYRLFLIDIIKKGKDSNENIDKLSKTLLNLFLKNSEKKVEFLHDSLKNFYYAQEIFYDKSGQLVSLDSPNYSKHYFTKLIKINNSEHSYSYLLDIISYFIHLTKIVFGDSYKEYFLKQNFNSQIITSLIQAAILTYESSGNDYCKIIFEILLNRITKPNKGEEKEFNSREFKKSIIDIFYSHKNLNIYLMSFFSDDSILNEHIFDRLALLCETKEFDNISSVITILEKFNNEIVTFYLKNKFLSKPVLKSISFLGNYLYFADKKNIDVLQKAATLSIKIGFLIKGLYFEKDNKDPFNNLNRLTNLWNSILVTSKLNSEKAYKIIYYIFYYAVKRFWTRQHGNRFEDEFDIYLKLKEEDRVKYKKFVESRIPENKITEEIKELFLFFIVSPYDVDKWKEVLVWGVSTYRIIFNLNDFIEPSRYILEYIYEQKTTSPNSNYLKVINETLDMYDRKNLKIEEGGPSVREKCLWHAHNTINTILSTVLISNQQFFDENTVDNQDLQIYNMLSEFTGKLIEKFHIYIIDLVKNDFKSQPCYAPFAPLCFYEGKNFIKYGKVDSLIEKYIIFSLDVDTDINLESISSFSENKLELFKLCFYDLFTVSFYYPEFTFFLLKKYTPLILKKDNNFKNIFCEVLYGLYLKRRNELKTFVDQNPELRILFNNFCFDSKFITRRNIIENEFIARAGAQNMFEVIISFNHPEARKLTDMFNTTFSKMFDENMNAYNVGYLYYQVILELLKNDKN